MFRESEGACIRRESGGDDDRHDRIGELQESHEALLIASALAFETHWTRLFYTDLFSAADPYEDGVVGRASLLALDADHGRDTPDEPGAPDPSGVPGQPAPPALRTWLLDALDAAGHAATRIARRFGEWREARASRAIFARLDARTLRDLGLEHEGLDVCHWYGIERMSDAPHSTGQPFGLPFTGRL